MTVLSPEYRYLLWSLVFAATGLFLGLNGFYPGLPLGESAAVARQAADFSFLDSNPPFHTLFWSLATALSGSPSGMFIVQTVLYWSGFFLFSLAVWRTHPALAPMFPLLGMAPFLINFSGTLMKESLQACLWLLAGGVWLLRGSWRPGWPASLVAWLLLAGGLLSHYHAVFASLPLIMWLSGRWGKRPAGGVLLAAALLSVLLYTLVVSFSDTVTAGRKSSHPWLSHLVLDFAIVSHAAGQSRFPLGMSLDETESGRIASCYRSGGQEPYVWGECSFVYPRFIRVLEKDGKGVVNTAVLELAANFPAWLGGRGAFWARSLFASRNWIFPVHADPPPGKAGTENLRESRSLYLALERYVTSGQDRLYFQGWFWLSAGVAVFFAAGCGRAGRFRDAAQALSLSGCLMMATFALVGTGLDFRFAYWGQIAVSTAFLLLVAMAIPGRKTRSQG